MEQSTNSHSEKEPWNKGKLVDQKPPLKLKKIWAIRIRDLALFNLAIDSKLRACDLMKFRVRNLTLRDQIVERAIYSFVCVCNGKLGVDTYKFRGYSFHSTMTFY